MLTWNWKNKMGEMTVVQKCGSSKVNIYEGNCMAVFINEYKEDGKDMYQLYFFLCDKKHAKNIVKEYGKLFFDKVRSIKLNLFYPQSKELFNVLIENGYKVTAYYKEIKRDDKKINYK